MSSAVRMAMVVPRKSRRWGSSTGHGEKTLGVTIPAHRRRHEAGETLRCPYPVLLFPKTGDHCVTRTPPCRRWGCRTRWRDQCRPRTPGHRGAGAARACGQPLAKGSPRTAPGQRRLVELVDPVLLRLVDTRPRLVFTPCTRGWDPSGRRWVALATEGDPALLSLSDTRCLFLTPCTRGRGPSGRSLTRLRRGHGPRVKLRVRRCYRQMGIASPGGLLVWRSPAPAGGRSALGVSSTASRPPRPQRVVAGLRQHQQVRSGRSPATVPTILRSRRSVLRVSSTASRAQRTVAGWRKRTFRSSRGRASWCPTRPASAGDRWRARSWQDRLVLQLTVRRRDTHQLCHPKPGLGTARWAGRRRSCLFQLCYPKLELGKARWAGRRRWCLPQVSKQRHRWRCWSVLKCVLLRKGLPERRARCGIVKVRSWRTNPVSWSGRWRARPPPWELTGRACVQRARSARWIRLRRMVVFLPPRPCLSPVRRSHRGRRWVKCSEPV
mmetsp:Transcript_135304/g.306096  ORF Transcript_135304/g.306096 Transcript_135304/m.306096 type:complete len:494 (+) Transcript_135304:594-2075(+)